MTSNAAPEELAETVVLNHNGGRLICRGRFDIGEELRLYWPEKHQEAQVRIVHRQLCGTGKLTEFGFEFIDQQNFWGPDPDISTVTSLPQMRLPEPWIAHMSRKHSALAGFCAGMFLFLAGEVVDLLVEHRLAPDIADTLSDAVVALSVAFLVFKMLCDAYDHHKAMVNRLQRIAEINHHIRNALQVIAYHVRSRGDASESAVEDVNVAITRIEWVLREVLPEGEKRRPADLPSAFRITNKRG